MSGTEPDLAMLARQQRQILDELGTYVWRSAMSTGTMRDDMRVMMAILQRLEGTVAGLVNEVRAMHSRHDRLARRVDERLAP